MREVFPEKQPGERLSAGHINKLSDVCRRVSTGMSGSYTSGRDNAITPNPPFVQSQVIINTIVDINAGLYTVFLRYYSTLEDANTWLTNEDTEYNLDASELGTEFVEGDKLVAFWNPQRGQYTPAGATGVSGTIIIKTPADGIPARVGTLTGKAICETFQIDETHNLESSSFGTILVYNISGVGVIGDVYGVASLEQETTKWLVVVESCGPA